MGLFRREGRVISYRSAYHNLIGRFASRSLVEGDQDAGVGAGVGTGDGVAKQEILAANDERSDCILCQIVVDPQSAALRQVRSLVD
jgi:hypothetical protein